MDTIVKLRPTTIEELQALLPGQNNIRAVANGHSGDPWPATTYLDVTAFNRPLAITEDTVTCQAGMELKQLIAFLADKGKTIEGLPSILHATIGGVIMTAAHGSGLSVVASQVQHAVFVLGNGQLLSMTADAPHFPAIIASAGMIGILYSVTLRIIPDTLLYQQRTVAKLPLDPIGWLQSGLLRQLFFNPYTHNALLYDHSRTPSFGKEHVPLLSKLLKNPHGEKLAINVHDNLPWALPRFIDLTYQILSGRTHGTSATVLSIPEYNVPYLDYEVAVPVPQAAQALAKLQALVLKWRDEHQYYLWFGLMMRYIPADPYPLSLAYGSDVIAFALPLYKDDISRAFIAEVQQVLGTRFHVGKYFPGAITDHNGWVDFNIVRSVLDPSNRFLPIQDLPPQVPSRQ